MGIGQSKKYLSSGDISSDDDDFDCDYWEPAQPMEPQLEIEAILQDNALDAIGGPVIAEPTISLDSLVQITSKLELYEIISLIYLLCDDSKKTQSSIMKALQAGESDKWLLEWAKSEIMWQKKLVEALCIVQNYEVLKELGYKKNDLQLEYLPFRPETTCLINKIRKIFYLISEKLTKGQTLDFIQLMEKQTSHKISQSYDHDYLELFFLDWEISRVEFSIMQNAFKKLNLEWFYDQIELILHLLPPPARTPIIEAQSKTMKDNANLTSSMDYVSGPSLGSRSSIDDSNRYEINPDKPGVILIINQESFYTEHEEKYKHLLHENKDEIQLADRQGTRVDRDRLRDLFSRMKFRVIVEDNLTHLQMLESIEKVTTELRDESSLIVCVLSHGSNGVVYGANSCKVEVKRIENVMCRKNKHLWGKPKFLILQACQGERCQKVVEEEDIIEDDAHNATDGVRNAPTADLITYWATIPGYAAIRNARTGSWFIQALCDEIEQTHCQLHVLDICTKINGKVSKKEWKVVNGVNIMTPHVSSTCTKAFYLPALGS